MNKPRRLTLTDFCIICGVLCMLSCLLFPRVMGASGLMGSKSAPFTTSIFVVRAPSKGTDGRVNLVAYNDSKLPIDEIVVQYATLGPLVVDHFGSRNKDTRFEFSASAT